MTVSVSGPRTGRLYGLWSFALLLQTVLPETALFTSEVRIARSQPVQPVIFQVTPLVSSLGVKPYNSDENLNPAETQIGTEPSAFMKIIYLLSGLTEVQILYVSVQKELSERQRDR